MTGGIEGKKILKVRHLFLPGTSLINFALRRRPAMCRVQLVGGDTGLSQLAERALNTTTEVHLATDEEDRAMRGEKARLALQDFLLAASGHVR